MEKQANYRIVVAEDEEIILESIVNRINSLDMGFVVAGAAQDGKEALQLIEKHSPDVLLTDIRMPVLDGLELLKIVSSKYPHIVKIVISGHDEFSYAREALIYEVKDYLLKPLKKEKLIETLSKIRIHLDAQANCLNQTLMHLKENRIYSAEEIVHMVELYIKKNYANEINFDLIAQNFNFNASYLSKIFTKVMGENPSKYLISLRINTAKHLLLNQKDIPIKDVGEMVGYPNQYHFSHVFKLCTGKSPAKFREDASIGSFE